MCKDEKSVRSAQRTDPGQERKEEPGQGGQPDQVQDKGDSGGEIAYQNKDIASKFFTQRLKGKSFGVYGLELPKVKAVLPTNIPVIRVNELRLDNLLKLADGSAAVVDYESDYKKESKVKYLNYLTGVVNQYAIEKRQCPNLRMIVIYTGDIRRRQVAESYDAGAVKMKIEPAFLSEVDGDEIYRRLREKVEGKQRVSDQEQMEFIIYPLTYRRKRDKRKRIDEAVRLALRIEDEEQQVFVLVGILTFTDKVIDQKTAEKIRRLIPMTKVAMIFEREKEEAVEAERRKTEAEKRRAEAEKRRAEAERRKKKAVEKEKRQMEKEKQRIERNFQNLIVKAIGGGEMTLEKIAEYTDTDISELAKLTQSGS